MSDPHFYVQYTFLGSEETQSRYFGLGKSPCGCGGSRSLFLMHRESLERQFSGARTTKWEGSRTWNLEVPGSIPGSRKSLFWSCWDVCSRIFTYVGSSSGILFGGGGDTFWSSRGHFFVKFWMSWDVSGSGLGRFSDGFGRVWGKMSDEVDQTKNQKCPGVCFPSRGASD